MARWRLPPEWRSHIDSAGFSLKNSHRNKTNKDRKRAFGDLGAQNIWRNEVLSQNATWFLSKNKTCVVEVLILYLSHRNICMITSANKEENYTAQKDPQLHPQYLWFHFSLWSLNGTKKSKKSLLNGYKLTDCDDVPGALGPNFPNRRISYFIPSLLCHREQLSQNRRLNY